MRSAELSGQSWRHFTTAFSVSGHIVRMLIDADGGICDVWPHFISGRGKIAMNLSHLLTASLAGAVVCFISGAEASPHFQAPMFSPLPMQAGFKCGLVNGKLVCGDKKSSGDADDEDNQKPKAGEATKNCKKARCEPGLVVLEKPNKYGACCEPKEGSPAPAPAEAQKCPYGMIGTPPNNCDCPTGTDFQGYKGCVKLNAGRICQNFDRSISNYGKYQDDELNFKKECVSKYKSKVGATCVTNEGSGNFDTCCCDYTY